MLVVAAVGWVVALVTGLGWTGGAVVSAVAFAAAFTVNAFAAVREDRARGRGE